MNNKADSRFLSPWLFLILALVGTGIIVGTLVFYSAVSDIRIAEAKAISNKLANAVINTGIIRDEVMNESYTLDMLMEDANLEKGTFVRGGNYYFNILIYDDENLIKNFSLGEKDFEKQCELPGDLLAICDYSELNVIDNYGNEVLIKIMTGSNQMGERI